MGMAAPLVLLNVVGLTSRWLSHTPRLAALGWHSRLTEVIPAVTCTAQATMLTGVMPDQHGIVGNGWLFRDTAEVRFWQQSNRLLQADPIYRTLRQRAAERGRAFRCAKLFWWFNQGADVDISVTPKPWYGADGNKVFGIHGAPAGLTARLETALGPFPFQTFWGPLAGLPCTQWIARAAAEVLRTERPDLTLVYLPHLDYGPQRLGIEACDMPRLMRELDEACQPVLEAARQVGARVWVVSEYGHVSVSRPIYLNRILRQAGLVSVRPGPFGESLDTFESLAFAVCDHQLAHVYLRDPVAVPRVREVLTGTPGVGQVYGGKERADIHLQHPRAGDLVALAERDAWFAYPFWLDDRQAPDYARTVDIHRKPGYDPCELFFDPNLWWPQGRALWRLVQKKLGFRYRMDVIPLDASLVRGSHGLPAVRPEDQPVLVGDGPAPSASDLPMTSVHDLLLEQFGSDV
jgi:predicted AlkP superfamily pyrophosphatase or phosphodiesterase